MYILYNACSAFYQNENNDIIFVNDGKTGYFENLKNIFDFWSKS